MGQKGQQLTVEELLIELEEARIQALESEQPGAAVNASLGKAKLLGLLIEKRELGVTVHKPGFSRDAIELSEDEWKRQFALPAGANAGEALTVEPEKPAKPRG